MSEPPKIFTVLRPASAADGDNSDNSLKVYIESNVEDKLYLTREMKIRGATITKSIPAAQIILVSSIHPNHAQIIYKEWGNKIPLVDCKWARQAVAVNKAKPMEDYLVTAASIQDWLKNDPDADVDYEDAAPANPTESRISPTASTPQALPDPPQETVSPSPRLAASSAAVPRRIFEKDNRSPFTFYIQMHIKNRTELARIVRSHGGSLAMGTIQDADFVVLSRHVSDFQLLLGSVPAGHAVVRPAWIEDCNKEGRLLNWKSYVEGEGTLPSPSSPRKRSYAQALGSPRKSIASPQKSPSLSQSTSKGKGKPTPSTQLASTNSPQPKRIAKPAKSSSSSTLFRSPTTKRLLSPTPPTEIISTRAGNAYTEADRQFALDCHRVLLHRDPTLPRSGITKYIATKAPHHTVSSWQSWVAKNIHYAYDEVRAEVAVVKSKDVPPQVAQPQPATTSTSKPGIELAQSLQRTAVYLRHAQSQGLSAVAALTKLDSTSDKCELARSWLDFYREHLVEIDQRMHELASRNTEVEDGAPPAKQRRTSSAETIVA